MNDKLREALARIKNDLLDIYEGRAMPAPMLAKRSLEWVEEALAEAAIQQSGGVVTREAIMGAAKAIDLLAEDISNSMDWQETADLRESLKEIAETLRQLPAPTVQSEARGVDLSKPTVERYHNLVGTIVDGSDEKFGESAWNDNDDATMVDHAHAEGFYLGWTSLARLQQAPQEVGEWIPVTKATRPDPGTYWTIHCGKVRLFDLEWETPGYEESFTAFPYWTDPNDGMNEIDWDDVTFYQSAVLPPAPAKEKDHE